MSDDAWFVSAMRGAPPSDGAARCIDEEPFDAGRLWAFKFEEKQDDAVATHLADCAHCRGLTRAMTRPTAARIDTLAGAETPSRRWWIASAAGIALAASAGLWWALRPAAPAYRAGPLEGAEKAVRNGEDAAVFLPRNTVRWQLTPAVPTAGVEVTAVAIGPGGARRALTPVVTASGVVRIDAKAAEVFGEEFGTWRIEVGLSIGGAVGRHVARVEYRSGR